jgi:hypothetical protein
VYGNVALLTLRYNQLKQMWPEVVEYAQLEDVDPEEEQSEVEMRGQGMWARTKEKAKRVGRALGMDVRENRPRWLRTKGTGEVEELYLAHM